MGKFSAPGNPKPIASPDLVLQRIPNNPQNISPIGKKYGVPAYFNNNLYVLGTPIERFQGNTGPPILDVVKQFAIAGNQINPMPVTSGMQPFQWYGNSPSISADGTADGIVWVVEAPDYQPNLPINPITGMPNPPAVLHAYDAANLANELYNSNTAHGGLDKPNQGIKFTVPTIADGKVFFGTNNGVAVYGLLGP
jgi:hypothetical protein